MTTCPASIGLRTPAVPFADSSISAAQRVRYAQHVLEAQEREMARLAQVQETNLAKRRHLERAEAALHTRLLRIQELCRQTSHQWQRIREARDACSLWLRSGGGLARHLGGGPPVRGSHQPQVLLILQMQLGMLHWKMDT